MDSFAPVALFVYNRPAHTRKVLQALSRSFGAKNTDLFIFADGPRCAADLGSVAAVRALILEDWPFRSVTVKKHLHNIGLYSNIITGINDVLKSYPSLIVLEDDVVVRHDFLAQMNSGLHKYQNSDVFHINAWAPYLNSKRFNSDRASESFYRSSLFFCWGWATWSVKWKKIMLDLNEILDSLSLSRRLSLSNHLVLPSYLHLLSNISERRSTWAIRWHATIVIYNGRMVTPFHSLTSNIGADGSGTHVDFINYSESTSISSIYPVHTLKNGNFFRSGRPRDLTTASLLASRLKAKTRVAAAIFTLLPRFLIRQIIWFF